MREWVSPDGRMRLVNDQRIQRRTVHIGRHERKLMNEQLRYNKNEEPMCISKPTMDRILKVGGKNIMCDAVALYVFYYHTAKWQGQTNAKCTVSYAANGLGITEERIRRAKAVLIELGLVSEFTQKNESGQVVGWYITVNFIHNHPTEKPEGGKSHKVENQETNALSTNILNTLSTNKEIHNNTKQNSKPISNSPPEAVVAPLKEQFERCWIAFNRYGAKAKAFIYWRQLKQVDRDSIEALIPSYMHLVSEGRYQKQFEGWINPTNRLWDMNWASMSKTKPKQVTQHDDSNYVNSILG